jgi:uncharacterized protein YjiS (DUF1127 family)
MYAAHPIATARQAAALRALVAIAIASSGRGLRAVALSASRALHAGLAGLPDAWRRHRRIVAGRRELQGLDARMLADIGIDRAGIDRAARVGRDR